MYFNDTLLKKYAQVLILYALNDGKGIKEGETVCVFAQQCSEPLVKAVCEEIWKAGGNAFLRFTPDWMDRYGLNRPQLEICTDEQLSFLPVDYWEGIVKSADHLVFIRSQPNVHALEGIDSNKVNLLDSAIAPFMEARREKERAGELGWTLCLYPTESAAKEAGMTLEEYTDQIIKACYLEEDDPVAKWKELQVEIEITKKKLDALEIESLHIKGENADLTVKIGPDRKWLGGSGHNIPSFEIFISPDWRGTDGWMYFNQPLFYNGKRIEGIYLCWQNGEVVAAKASKNQDALLSMIAQPGASRIGEYSWTPAGFSNISVFMAHTLYDENRGGEFGNRHVALGNAYTDAFPGDQSTQTAEDWERMGYNKSVVHTDIISTENHTITATLKDGTTKTLFKDGRFLI